jgi:hypothetical protein
MQQFSPEHLQMSAGLQALTRQGTKTWIAIWDHQGSECNDYVTAFWDTRACSLVQIYGG